MLSKTLLFAVLFVVAALLFSAIMYDLAQNTIYKTTFIQRMRNNLYFAAAKFPKNLIVTVASMLPFIMFAFVPYTWAVIAVATLYFVYGFGVVMLLQMLYSHSVFDKCINDKNYPQLVNKGLDAAKKCKNVMFFKATLIYRESIKSIT